MASTSTSPVASTSTSTVTTAGNDKDDWSDEEKKALMALAELYSGFINERDVASRLARLKVTTERLEEILRYRMHPALYTQLVWKGTGFEQQAALPLDDIINRIATADMDSMTFVTKLACNKLWQFGMQTTWSHIKEAITALRNHDGVWS